MRYASFSNKAEITPDPCLELLNVVKRSVVTAGLYTVRKREAPGADTLSCDIWMDVVVLFSPSADKSHSAVTKSLLADVASSRLIMNC